MALPPRVFWALEDLAVRWGCAPADIVGWATEGIIEIVVSIGLVHCCGTEPLVGLVAVCAEDIMPLFRRNRPGPKACLVWRIRQQGTGAWKVITDPAQGVAIEVDDLLVTAKTAQRFEDEYDPLHRVHVSPGRSSRHDWEGMLQALMIRLFEHGLPESQAELVAEGQEWFVAHAKDGSVPDESQIRRKLSPIWRALKKPQ
ncbi:hypothetical protein [Roseovarius autotrophicus]|uniref:hypothetical protein n=1 Tax=Roseovarius autotrophicus TaxID=2824121 RepID=UPI001B37F48A|nr:hypothetical protein [Roseovarius autotrophicus]